MKVTLLPANYKPVPQFTRPANEKGDTHFLFTSEKYEIEAVFDSSMFYAPDFFRVKVRDRNGRLLWDGGDSIFLDCLFNVNFFSNHFDKMVLVKVNSTSTLNDMQVTLVDLALGSQTTLTQPDRCYVAGHFVGFNAVYYDVGSEIICQNLATGNKMPLLKTLHAYFPQLKWWNPCPVSGCIVAITDQPENNLFLFDLVRLQIKESATLLLKQCNAVNLSFSNITSENTLIASAYYSKKDNNGIMKAAETEHFCITF